jgi:4-alpha-glucanotransferase
MLTSRASGILLHPTSLPGKFGIGDLSPCAYTFVDFLAESGQQVWQILPLGPTGYHDSPYVSYSAFAGNPLLLNLDWLHAEGLLDDEDFANLPEFPDDHVDYGLVIQTKMPLLRKASQNFQKKAPLSEQERFQEFCLDQAYWLDDYALFMALREAHEGASWHEWEPPISARQPEAIEAWKKRLSAEIFHHKYLQAEFSRQWSALKTYANQRGIKIFGDIPIYVAEDSADVWANREIFCLDEEGKPSLLAGVPPDYFSETGQLWGNPVYNWDKLKETDFQWWVQRFQDILNYFDIVRIDHFRGLQAYWVVEQGETSAIDGEWMLAPGEAFFTTLKKKLGKLPIVAEDLGVITPEVEALRDQFEFPGMKILQFAFGNPWYYDPGHPFLPFNFATHNCVVYTGTHDNNTTVGWFQELSPQEQARVTTYLGCLCPDGIHWSLIRLAMSSIANLAIFPLQDILGLGSEARMNVPSQADGNWSWRYQADALTDELKERLKTLTTLYGRAPRV